MATESKVPIKSDEDLKRGSSDDVEAASSLHSAQNGSSVVVDPEGERSYVRKLDFYLLPYLSLMYFFNAVDRSNLGNAKTDGIEKDLNFKGNETSLGSWYSA
ncbi:hypothetical protein CaCOL14_012372 [Colletotrichum acutatum]